MTSKIIGARPFREISVLHVVGARPNFMKAAPVLRALADREGFSQILVHTGQHYDAAMSDVFFRELGLQEPDLNLEVGSGSHSTQTAQIMMRLEEVVLRKKPDLVLVYGDVNSTVAAALVCAKTGTPIGHVEAGLRSFDRTMPEEINRLLTDAVSDLLLVSEPSAVENLKKEGIDGRRVRLVGNVMIDTLCRELIEARRLDMWKRFGVSSKKYALLTLHRPSNVDDPATLRSLLGLFLKLSQDVPIIFPVHPRTRRAAEIAGISNLLLASKGWITTTPLSYRENLSLMAEACMVITDSGGMQEESTFLKVPCLTLRWNTERPITIELGTSRLVGNDPVRIRDAFDEVLSGSWPAGQAVPLWDGNSAIRIADSILEWYISQTESRGPYNCR